MADLRGGGRSMPGGMPGPVDAQNASGMPTMANGRDARSMAMAAAALGRSFIA